MAIQRRRMLTAALGGAFSASLLTAGRVDAAPAPVFEKPTADNPIIACYNENPLGLSAAARKAVADSAAVANRYPFVRCEVLRKACAQLIGGKPEEIVLSQGSAEAIRASVEAHNGPGASLVTAELTYSDGQMAAVRNNIPVIKVKMGLNWSTVFILDEAYAEFVEDKSYRSAAELVREGLDNVIVLKTFSKIFAMAGLRLGFAYAAPERVKKVHDHIAYDFFQNTPAIEAALAEMNDKAFLKQSLEETLESRRIMEEVLKELQLEYLPSQTNFVFFNLKKPLKVFADAMKAENIMVGRPFPPATTWCRVSYVRPAEMKYVADVMRALRTKGVI